MLSVELPVIGKGSVQYVCALPLTSDKAGSAIAQGKSMIGVPTAILTGMGLEPVV